ncbi:hypothetical protein Aeh1ORF090c [Aeromonas phage Aeh1]|uniref:Uncharacterized protein n=1 Tax=Aeromonas phage Aeh1 TaxID=2880362 RepID=Q76YZ5_9CAUD|nr:hypothetical protein Aeh1p096 [Aeromonas phage Aeh1]AAQ17751.1 hypothetical protein Aeh1ORF090c [Aeromonas phage Aeh1]
MLAQLSNLECVDHINAESNEVLVVFTKAEHYYEISLYHSEDFERDCYVIQDIVGVGIESFNFEDILNYIKMMEA